jgi:hypothetical protein
VRLQAHALSLSLSLSHTHFPHLLKPRILKHALLLLLWPASVLPRALFMWYGVMEYNHRVMCKCVYVCMCMCICLFACARACMHASNGATPVQASALCGDVVPSLRPRLVALCEVSCNPLENSRLFALARPVSRRHLRNSWGTVRGMRWDTMTANSLPARRSVPSLQVEGGERWMRGIAYNIPCRFRTDSSADP